MAISSQVASPLPSLAPSVSPQPAATPEGGIAVPATTNAERNSSTDTSTSEQARQPDNQSPEDAIEEINTTMNAWATNLRFEIDPEAHRLVVSVVDTESGDVLRTVPNEAAIRIAKMVVGLQGKMVDTTA